MFENLTEQQKVWGTVFLLWVFIPPAGLLMTIWVLWVLYPPVIFALLTALWIAIAYGGWWSAATTVVLIFITAFITAVLMGDVHRARTAQYKSECRANRLARHR